MPANRLIQGVVRFAGSAVRIEAQGEDALRLVRFSLPQIEPGQPEGSGELPCLRVSTPAPGRYSLEENGAALFTGSFGPAATVLMERATYHLADHGGAGLVFHGALVAWQGKGLALLGKSGAGKSTLAAWLAGNGFTCLTDELVFIAADGLLASGLARPVFLKGASAALFPDLEQRGAERVEALPHRPEGWLAPLCSQELQGIVLAGVVFPQYQPGAELQVEALSRPGAAVSLAELLVNARNLPENGFPGVLQLATELPAWRTVYSKMGEMMQYFVDYLI